MELSKEQIVQLEVKLKECIKYSVTTYTPIRLIKEGLLDGFSVWTDTWPNFTVVIVVPDRNIIENVFLNKKFFIFCPERHVKLREMLTSNKILDWTCPFKLHGVSTEVVAIADDIFKNPDSEFGRGQTVSFTSRKDAETYLYMATENTLMTISVPDGINGGYMTANAAANVAKAWKFQVEGIDDYIKILLSMKQHSVCLYDSEGTPVAWAIEQIHGTNGMLYVNPSYRRKGLAKYTQYLLSKKVIQRDGCAFVVIETDNKISINLHESIGFLRVENLKLVWQEYMLK